jgi:hypothetical protein
MTTKPLFLATVLSVLCACGGGTQQTKACIPVDLPTATDPNAMGAVVDSGPECVGYANGLFTSVTLCEPGTSSCQTIDHMLVDTGSVGVRVLESELTLALPTVTSTSGQALAECTPFVEGTAWGPVRTADVILGAEFAVSLPIQVIGEGTYTMPANCTGAPITDFKTLAANGILGLGVHLQDCGADCAQPASSILNPGLYYECSSAQTCAVTSVPVAQQVAHPVAAFPFDNNGTIIQLPSVPADGAPSVPGLLVFGIGTQPNNGLGAATVLALDERGHFTTTFPIGGLGYTSYLDSGSNGLFFLDAATANLKQCTGGVKEFYCPASTANLGATLLSSSGASTTIVFSVANPSTLSSEAFAFSNLAGPTPGFPLNPSAPGFDWGLPFFFGRTIYTAIENQSTPAGAGPYVAF